MSADYTTVGLIANCKRRGSMAAGSGWTTSQVLVTLTEQLRNYIPAFLKSIREEFIISQLSTVPIPVRACGVALRTIGWTQADGRVTPLPRIEPERRAEYGLAGGQPCGFMLQGNNVILLPSTITSGTMVVSYQQRPGELVLPTSCARIDSAADEFTLTTDTPTPSWPVLDDFSVSRFDIVGGAPNFDLKAMDLELSNYAPDGPGGDFTFTTALPVLAAGDWLCLAGETPVPMIPLECFDLLAQAAAVEIAQSTGSTKLQPIKDGLKDLRSQVMTILSPRADGSARVVISRSGLGRRRY